MASRPKSTAEKADAAWKRARRRKERLSILPMNPDNIDWDDLRRLAAEMRMKLKLEEVDAHRQDLLTVRNALGYIPEG